MITNTSFDTNFQTLPLEIQDHIKGYVPNMVDHASRDKLIIQLKSETEQKVGLYGENLIFLGLPLCHKLIKTEKNYNLHKTELENLLPVYSSPKNHWYSPVPALFANALDNPTGKSVKALNALFYINYGAAEALKQLNDKATTEKSISDLYSKYTRECEFIKSHLKRIREQRTTEQTIYDACGGKTKFHDLKILPWEDAKNDKMYGKIHVGETVMRGLDNKGCPFIAISLQKPGTVLAMLQQKGKTDKISFTEKEYDECKLLNTITVLKQESADDSTRWANKGHTGLLNNGLYSVNEFGIKTGNTGTFYIKNKDNMKYFQKPKRCNVFPTVKKLLTTGSCLYDAENPDRGMFKLTKQM